MNRPPDPDRTVTITQTRSPVHSLLWVARRGTEKARTKPAPQERTRTGHNANAHHPNSPKRLAAMS